MSPSTFAISWVNGGDAFEVSPDQLTMGAIEEAQLARLHALEEGTEDLQDIPEVAEDLYRRELTRVMEHAENRVLIYNYLVQVDASLEEMSSKEAIDRLGASTVDDLGQAVREASEEIETDDEDVVENPSG